MDFNETLFHGFLLKGELRDAILYLGRFPEQEELYRRRRDHQLREGFL